MDAAARLAGNGCPGAVCGQHSCRAVAADQLEQQRPQQDQGDDDVNDDGDRLAPEACGVAGAELQSLAQLLFEARPEDDAEDERQDGSPNRRIMNPNAPSASRSTRSNACRFTE
jgi:hypothetical protein